MTHLYVVSIGAGLREDGWDGWIAAHFQVIFGALVPLQEISKVASWFSEKVMDDVMVRTRTSRKTYFRLE